MEVIKCGICVLIFVSVLGAHASVSAFLYSSKKVTHDTLPVQ